MNSSLSIAAADLNQTPLDWSENLAHLREAVELASTAGAELLLTPELSLCGYGCEDWFLSSDLVARAQRLLLSELLPLSQKLPFTVGLPFLHDGKTYNGVALLAQGKILGVAAKQNLARTGIHYEPRWFSAWPAGVKVPGNWAGQNYPVGQFLLDFKTHKIGFEICEDAWAEDRVGNRLKQEGATVLLNASASHFAFGKSANRHTLALQAGVPIYAYANLVGNESGRVIYDGGSFVYEHGVLTRACPRLHYSAVCLALADDRSSWEKSAALKEEEFPRAVSLGLFDYLRKSKARGFTLSLSGGADSSAVAVLVGLMVRWGVQELGLEGFWRKAFSEPLPAELRTESDIVHRLLCTVYQKTQNSSPVTQASARVVADAVGAEHLEWSVETLVQGYTSLVAAATSTTLSWQKNDLALQNIQARVRSPAVWLLANLREHLLLTTSNRSEAAVGYATMDGDTSGGLCPLGGIDKHFLRSWLLHLQLRGLTGVAPQAYLAKVNELAPTAELRPQAAGQTDEADLMPYAVLAALERLAVGKKLAPAAVLPELQGLFPEFSAELLYDWTKKFFRLWSASQWKRERIAPAFHLEPDSVDPKTACRFPILSGGFRAECDELAGKRP